MGHHLNIDRGFKEVLKDLQDYDEKASGAKINYVKTKGLWLGKWRQRTDDPFQGMYRSSVNRIEQNHITHSCRRMTLRWNVWRITL